MAKVDVELVKHILQRNVKETRLVAQIMEDLGQELKMQEEEEPPAPKEKKQFVIVASDPEGVLDKVELVGWVVQILEEEAPQEALEKLYRGAYEFNLTKKGRRMPVSTIAEVCEVVPGKILKEQKVWVKTKEPVFIVASDNQVPMEAMDKLKKAARE